MGKVIASISTSVDGYVTGPDDGPGLGLGKGGERLHYWVMGGPWTYDGGHDFAMHGPDKEFFDDMVDTVRSGVVGRGMYDASGAWGGTNPFPGPLFVLTHRTETSPRRSRGSRSSPTSTTRSRRRSPWPVTVTSPSAAGRTSSGRGSPRDVVDELVISTAPVILGAGKRLFDGFDKDVDLEVIKVYSSPYATHVRYTVKK